MSTDRYLHRLRRRLVGNHVCVQVSNYLQEYHLFNENYGIQHTKQVMPAIWTQIVCCFGLGLVYLSSLISEIIGISC